MMSLARFSYLSTSFFVAYLPFLIISFLALTRSATAATLDAAGVVTRLKTPAFGLSSGTEVFLRSDPNFVEETTHYTIHDAPTYVVAVKPALECDVRKIVKFASDLHIPFLGIGGGNGFATTFGKLKNGIEIDLGFFKNVSVDAAASTMTIGGAVLISDVIEPLYNAGKEIQTGSDVCIGMLGATLGGGVGRYNGLHGMMIDALLSVRLVIANGDIVTASKTQNSDLFWGIRGAGFNFGIVVSATYEVYDLTNKGQIMNADFLFLPNASTPVFEYFKSLETDQSAELSLIFQTGFQAALGGAYIVVNAVYAGPLDKGAALVQPLLDAQPFKHNISEINWGNLISSAFFGAKASCTKGTIQNVYGMGIKTYNVPTFQKFFADLQTFYHSYPSAQNSVFFIEAFPNQAVAAIPNEATAYPHRDITAHLLFNYGYNDTSLENTVNIFAQNARSEFSATSGFDSLQVYVSYGHGDEGPVPLYAERKLPRLRALKRKWDPTGQFNFNQPF